MRRVITLLLSCLWVVPLDVSEAVTDPSPKRLVAIGDIHGDLDAFVSILRATGLIDEKHRWSGGETVLVQTGDFLDRGPDTRPVMDLLMSLQKEAPRQGGSVEVLLGNHEAMNLLSISRDVGRESYAHFVDERSEERRREAWKEYSRWAKAHKKAVKKISIPFEPMSRSDWMETHPPGFLEARKALGPKGTYGRWLRGLPTMARVDDIVFVHGGLSTGMAEESIEEVNARVWDEITELDECRGKLLQDGLITRTAEASDMVAAGLAQLAVVNERLHRAPQGLEQRYLDSLRVLRDCVDYEDWYLVHEEGPFWFRGFARWSEEEGRQKVATLKETWEARHFVAGHTPQKDGRIHVRFDGSIFLIDTGMLSSVYTGGRAAALERLDGRFHSVYLDEKVLLWEPESVVESARLLAGGRQALAAAALSTPKWWESERPRSGLSWVDIDGKPLPFETEEEVAEFLRSAAFGTAKRTRQGINQPYKVVLEKGDIRAHAVFRFNEEVEEREKGPDGRFYLEFRDSYIFEPAAYELNRMLGMDRVPPVVERRFRGESGSLQIWVENAMTEAKRREKEISPPDPLKWVRQTKEREVFDSLIYNWDRNLGNLLIDPSWNVWLIDHTRTFLPSERPKDLDAVTQCPRTVWERLHTLDREAVRRRLDPYLRPAELEALFARWDVLVDHLSELIEENGEAGVIFE